MRKVTVADAARDHLQLITEYLSAFGSATARSFALEYDRIWKLLQDDVVEFPLARHPDLARAGYHAALIKNYIMLYRITESGDVFIAHVFHQSQDYATLVKDV